jgi:hypothetical protein
LNSILFRNRKNAIQKSLHVKRCSNFASLRASFLSTGSFLWVVHVTVVYQRNRTRLKISTLRRSFIYELTYEAKSGSLCMTLFFFGFYLSIGFVGEFTAKTIPTATLPPPPAPPQDSLISGVQKLSKICEASGNREIVGRVHVKKIRVKKYKQGSGQAIKRRCFFAKILRNRT